MASIITKFAHLQISLEEVLKATNNFHDDNIIGHGGYGPAYKGLLLRSGKLMKIAARRLDRKYGKGDVEFWTEISVLSDLKHTNLVSIIGFCDEKDEKVIITTYEAKGSLNEHLTNPNLTWTQRLKICLGVARALSYIHYDEMRGYSVIHLNLKSSSILLDENWEAKLSGFKVSIKQSVNQTNQVILSEPIDTTEIEKTKSVTNKSDIYSFGVVLLELLCGRKMCIEKEANRFLVPLAKYQYERGTPKDIIHPSLWNQISPQSLDKYSKLAYSCIDKEGVYRTNTNNIVQELEKALEFQLRYENLENNLAHLKIPLNDIKLATNNFSEAYAIVSSEDYTLYTAELQHLVEENSSFEVGKNKDKHLKRHVSVIIKRYPSGHDEYKEEEFFTEVETLTSIKHRNIVTLLGFCVEDSEMIIAIDNLSNGYLGEYLGNINDMRILTWEKRLNICIDVAQALKYLHFEMEDQKMIINRDIHSRNIGLDQFWGAKIVDFRDSVYLPQHQEDEAIYLNSMGRPYYIDPEYKKTSKLKRESDVYSFGVVLFEILCGRIAHDPIYLKESDKGLAPVARRNFCMGKLEGMIDPIIKEETSDSNFVLNRGPNKDSLNTFIKIAYQCVAETQDQRPTMKVVVKELEKALFFHKSNKDNPRIPLEDVKLATQNFHDDNCIDGGGFWKVYKGNLQDGDGFKTIVAKRMDTRVGQWEQQFFSELQILLQCKHENVIGLVGYCDEKDEKIIVYEYAPRGSLDRYLNDASLTWMKRLKICVEVASALDFLHGGVGKQAKVMHRDIKTASILLNHDWKAKLADFGLSLISPITQETTYVIDSACGTIGYVDPLYQKSGFLTIESDIYSFGIVLFEILCGRSAFAIREHEGHYLPDFIKNNFEEGKHDDVVYKQIREQIVPISLTTYQEIAYQCLHHEREKRPTTKQILTQLKKALEFQNMASAITKCAYLQIPLEEIVMATKNFHDDKIIGQSGLGTTYKGRLLRLGKLIRVAVRRLNCKHGEGYLEFLTEISVLSDLKHTNLVSIVGFCDEKDEKIIITTYAANGSLSQYLNSPNLTWTQRLRICVGVARALNYLHYDEGRDYAIIHCNINSDTILLDRNWEVKLSGFHFSIKQLVYYTDQVCLCEHIGATGYMDPATETSGGVTHKSDIYAFGVVLFEILCGRKAFVQDQADGFLVPLAKYHYENRTLQDIIHPDLWNDQLSPQSFDKYSKLAYSCIQEERAHRPYTYKIVGKLAKALKLQLRHKNLTYMKVAHLELQFEKVVSATNNFADENLIKKGEFANDYKGQMLKSGQLVDICARRLNPEYAQGDIEFRTEISILSNLQHKNIISFIGFCNKNDEKILVYEHAVYGSLDQHLSGPNLTWFQILKICLGVARGLSYIHYDVIHCDINSSKIYLGKDWEPKISGFEFSTKYPQSLRHPLLSSHHFDNTNMTREYDVYCFGVLLFEIIYGMKLMKTEHGVKGELDDIINPNLKKQMERQSLTVFTKVIYSCLNEDSVQRPTMDWIVKKLEEALELQWKHENLKYREFAHLAIRLEEILSATNNFDDENLIKEDEFGKDYKGQMSQSGQLIDICARRLKSKHGQGDIEFWNEISVLSNLQHKNIISLVGFCDENDEKIIIYEYAVHESLDRHLRGPNLTLFQRLIICLGVAHGLNHIHYDVIHCDINSSKIFLDEDWEPKISGFELSTKYPQSWRHRFLLSHHFNNANMTPKYDVYYMTPKYDVYCFGVLLFEVLCGEKPMKTQCHGIINPKLREQMDRQSSTLLTKIIDDCLNEHPVQRPTMDQVVKELEDVFELQWKYKNHQHSTAANKDGASSNLLKMERLKIPLNEIWAATNGFDEAHFVASGGFGSVYKGELYVLDIHKPSSIEGEQPKVKTKTNVAIKCIKNRLDEVSKQGFLTEIELLTSCKHQNIISLLGFCMEADDIILVYEYATNGSLSDYLKSTRNNSNLPWAKRIEICLGIACGINYLHTSMEGKPRIIHRDIKSENILLDVNLNAKVADFGLSKFHFANQQTSTVHTKHVAGTDFYVDPEYLTSFKYKRETDIYSFGVVLFEMLSGRLAYEPICIGENDKGLAPIARRRFNEKTLKELIDPKMIEEDGEHIVTLNRGPNQESFEAFSRIANQCLAETQAKRPTMEVVIKELQTALNLQGETVVLTRFRLNDILFVTENFLDANCIGLHEYGEVYKAELDDFNNKSLLAFKEKSDSEWPKTWPKTRINVAIKRISGSRDAKQRFFSEIEMHTCYKHPNVVSLLGFCDEGDETILVYEHASNRSLDDYLKSIDNMDSLTWMQRLHTCLGIARGLDHLHTKMDSQERIIHGDITSANILFDKNREPKVVYFGISKFHLANQGASSTQVYRDPEFEKTHILIKESDIYSFGVILFEIFSGRLAYDPIYVDNNQKGLPHVARNHFNDGTIKTLLDPKLKEVTDDDIFTSNKGPNQDSLDSFLKIAYQCLEEAQARRPTMKIVIKELEMALNFQENLMKRLQISLKDIELATKNFSNYLGSGRYWDAYTGELPHANGNKPNTIIVVKRWGSKFDDQFRRELDIVFKRKHKNIIGLVGFCNETNEKIIVYEHMSKGSLDKYLKDSNLRWMKRLRICVDVASALEFLHEGDVTLKKVIHRDIKSHGILLNDNWDAKIYNFELSSLDSSHQGVEHISDDAYLGPQYNQGLIGKADIYSFGVILFEILCGRPAWVEGCENNIHSLGPLAKHYYEQGKLDEIVFRDIREQIVPQSLITFADIAYQCLHDDHTKRPVASEVAIQLKKALEFQEDCEIWEPKLPTDYKEIMRLSKTPEIYVKRDIYKKLSQGILLSKEKVLFKLNDNGEAHKMISATEAKFCYKNHESLKWRSVHISRFPKVAKMLDISNLKIQVTIDNKFLTPNVIYGVYLIFKFSDPRTLSRKRTYMNLKYKKGTVTLHSYFATWRDDEWMMIELHRFLNHKEDVSFAFLLERFSRYYCSSGSIYVEGIEFRAIKKMSNEDNKNQNKVQQVHKSNLMLDQLLTVDEKLFLRELNGKKHLMLSAIGVLYNSEKWEFFCSKSSADSRFQNVMELLPHQVFRIKYKIETQMLSPFMEYTCYLVFKVSEKCQGLHCPVKVRDLLYRRNKENQIIYFRSPAHVNHHDAFWVPEQRKDGWMEVRIWKFNSKYNNNNNLRKDVIPVNLKLVTYEGTMSGLIICGLEFRPT